jgi:hypothetical protein
MQFNNDTSEDPPIKVNGKTVSRCETHPESTGEFYRQHLEEEHRPEVQS